MFFIRQGGLIRLSLPQENSDYTIRVCKFKHFYLKSNEIAESGKFYF